MDTQAILAKPRAKPKSNDAHVHLRMPIALRNTFDQIALVNGRSRNAEILVRLIASLQGEGHE